MTLKPFGDANLVLPRAGRLAAGRDSIVAIGDEPRRIVLRSASCRSSTSTFVRCARIAPPTVQIEAVNATFANLKIGYIRGVGDNVMPMLEELGLSVVELDPATLPRRRSCRGFTTIVLGSRAYEANPAAMLVADTPLLMKFARDGGTVVTQYGHSEMAQPGILPFPITLARTADRVTDENAVVRVLDPGSPLLSTPNKIVEADFAHWVQERTLYMPQYVRPAVSRACSR